VLLSHLKGFEVGRMKRAKGFEVQNDYVKVSRIWHTCELLDPLKQLGDLFLGCS
jgi:hypothetical protein